MNSSFHVMRQAANRTTRCSFAVLLLLALAVGARGQEAGGLGAYDRVPVLTGGAGYVTTFSGGSTELTANITPVLLMPVGRSFLVEARAEIEGEFEKAPGDASFHGPVNKEIQYLQLDWITGRYATVTVGRFLTPFGIFNERLYPIWVRNLQTDPLILPIGGDSSNGAMVRGGVALSRQANLNYAVYFSAASTVNKLESDRLAGTRVGLFFPKARIEVGGSVQHRLQEERSNLYGAHFAWQPRAVPFDLRSEYAFSTFGRGYWIEGAYRLSQVSGWPKLTQHAQLVARVQEFFLSTSGATGAAGEGLPTADTQMFEFGTNYYFTDGLRAMASYGRQFSSAGNANVWTVGVTYRFAFPLGRSGR